MTHRSPWSTAEALVPTGRALRRVSTSVTSVTPAPSGRGPRRVRGALVVVLLTALSALGLTPAAWAHGGSDDTVAAVMDRVSVDMPGVKLSVENTTLGAQFVLENPTPTEVTINSAAGDPLFRIGPGGVLGNFRSPEWYTSKVAGGDVTVPPRAADRGKPVWVRVSTEPSWGWFDHRLHNASLNDDQKAGMEPLDPFGAWSVPIGYGDRQGTAEGHFEYRPELGSFAPTLSDNEPAPGVRLTTLPGNPTPGMSVDYRGQGEVVVLGDADEPFLRITPRGTEANELSPTWTAQQGSADGRGGDPAAEPRWISAGNSPQASFTLKRADPDQSQADLYAITSPTDVKNWTLSMLVDRQRVDTAGVTTFNPVDRGSDVIWWWVGGGVLLVLLVAAGIWWMRRRSGPGARTGNGSEHGHHRKPVGAER